MVFCLNEIMAAFLPEEGAARIFFPVASSDTLRAKSLWLSNSVRPYGL